MIEKFCTFQEIRSTLHNFVQYMYEDDTIIRKLFLQERIDHRLWCRKIVKMGEWATLFDELIFCYLIKANLVVVGNYSNGFICSDMQKYLTDQLKIRHDISKNGTIFIYHHAYGSPLLRTYNANHFGYLAPILHPNFQISIDTIQALI